MSPRCTMKQFHPLLSEVSGETDELLYRYTAANGSRLTDGRGELAGRLVSAVLLFLAFCLNKQVVRPAEYTRLRFEWINALLPGRSWAPMCGAY